MRVERAARGVLTLEPALHIGADIRHHVHNVVVQGPGVGRAAGPVAVPRLGDAGLAGDLGPTRGEQEADLLHREALQTEVGEVGALCVLMAHLATLCHHGHAPGEAEEAAIPGATRCAVTGAADLGGQTVTSPHQQTEETCCQHGEII